MIEFILTKTIQTHHCVWDDKIPKYLWAYRNTWNTIGFTPYDLVYGKNVVFPIEFEIKTLRTNLKLIFYLTKTPLRLAYGASRTSSGHFVSNLYFTTTTKKVA
jgi:hypothetical protein